MESDNIIKEINDIHRALAIKYGFYFVDLCKFFGDMQVDKIGTRIMMPDPRHITDSYMYTLGANIKSYINRTNLDFNRHSISSESNFTTIENLNNLKTKIKSNSAFERKLNILSHKVHIELDGYSLVGIETWCDNFSQIKIIPSDSSKPVIKSFSENLSFNEIEALNLNSFTLDKVLGKRLKETEPSVNVQYSDMIKSEPLISSLLFRKNTFNILDITSNSFIKNIDTVIPDVRPFIKGTLRFLEKNNKYQSLLE